MNSFRQNLTTILILFSLVSSEWSFSKNADSPIDSLKQVLNTAQHDTIRVHVLNAIVQNYIDLEELDSALKYSEEAIRYAEKADFKKGLVIAIFNKGKVYADQGNYPAAMSNYHSALRLYHQAGDKKGVADVYNLIANAFHLQGDYTQALTNQYSALKIRESIGDEEGVASSYNNIATIYRIQGDYPAALKNFTETLRVLQKFGNKKKIAIAHNQIGTVYTLQGKYPEALQSYIASLKIRKEIADKKDIIASYFNIADSFSDLFEKDSVTKSVTVAIENEVNRTIPRTVWLDTALKVQTKAYDMNEEIGNKYYKIFGLSGLGRIQFLRRNYQESVRYYTQAYGIAEEMHAVNLQQEIAKYLSDNYNLMKDFKNGMEWYIKYSAHKDSLFNELKTDDLTRTRLKYEFEKKESETKAIQDKRDALAKVELVRQKKMRNVFFGGFTFVLLFAGIFFFQRNHIRREKSRSDTLLLNILPSEIASELKQTGASRTRSFSEVTVMFADFVDFTILSAKISPEALVQEIHICFSAFDHIIQKHKIEKIKTIGDAYMCAGGLPVEDPNHALEVVNAALEIRQFVQQRKSEKEAKNEIAFDIRIGLHSGPVVAGIVGVKKYAYDIWGDTVNIAARIEQNSLPGKINISSKTYELVKDKFNCTYRGKIMAKNKGEIDMYFLEV